jgi:mono/diheme cytochrome c family protein
VSLTSALAEQSSQLVRLVPPIPRAVGALALLGLLGCTNAAGPQREMRGKTLYDRQCARCHGIDGRPTTLAPTARDLTNRSYIDELGDDRIMQTIMAGKPPVMPAFGGQFSQPEIDLLVAYVRSLSNPELGPDRMLPRESDAP